MGPQLSANGLVPASQAVTNNGERAAPASRDGTVVVIASDTRTRWQLRDVAETEHSHVECYPSVQTARSVLQRDRPGCVVLDASRSGGGNSAMQQELSKHGVRVPVIVLIEGTAVCEAVAAMKTGAYDVIEKPLSGSQVLSCIRGAIALDRETRRERATHREIARCYARLTARERDVLQYVVNGSKSKEIAARLGVQEKTVEVYRSRVNKKMHTHNAAELARAMRAMEQ